MPAEFGNHGLSHGDANVIDAGASTARDLARGGNELVAELARRDEGDVALRGDRAVVVAIAGKGEGGIGEREDEAAMGDALAVYHFWLDHHRQRRAAGADFDDLHAETARGVVFLPHRVRAGARESSGDNVAFTFTCPLPELYRARFTASFLDLFQSGREAPEVSTRPTSH